MTIVDDNYVYRIEGTTIWFNDEGLTISEDIGDIVEYEGYEFRIINAWGGGADTDYIRDFKATEILE